MQSKDACLLAFIVSSKACIVTIIASDVSGVTIIINITLLVEQAFLNLCSRLWLTHIEL